MKKISDEAMAILANLIECADAWDRDVCLLDNITAGEISDTCKDVLQVTSMSGSRGCEPNRQNDNKVGQKMIRKIFCFFGFHKYETRVWTKVGTKDMTERVCIYCEFSPTWIR